jgi:hypothetical protein
MVATFEPKKESELTSKTTTVSKPATESGSAAGMPLFLQTAKTVPLQTAPDLKDATADEAERIRKLNEDYAIALAAKNWQLTAELLNAFSASDIQTKLTPLSRGTIGAIHQGAIDNPKVGGESQVANLTRAVYLDLNYENALKTGAWGDAATYLNGFNETDIISRVQKLDPVQLAKLYAAAKTNDRITRAIIAKGFALSGEDFRAFLKQATSSGIFADLSSKLAAVQTNSITKEVVIPTTLLKPATNTIADDFKRANELYNPVGIEIEQGNPVEISEATTKLLIGADESLDEFTANDATAEEIKLVEENRQKGRLTGYWVPALTKSRGETLGKGLLGKANFMKNLKDDRISVVINTSSRVQDSFAHEVGHALGLDHATDVNNLMTSGKTRNTTGAGIDQLTAAQLAIIRASALIELGKAGLGK